MSEVKVSISQSEQPPKPTKRIGIRHLQFLLMTLTLVIFMGMRTCMSVAIISMTETTPPDPSIPTYPEWDNTDAILSSFFWGLVLPQIFAGEIIKFFGIKWFLVVNMDVGSIVHIATPAMAESFGSSGVMVCRIIQGFSQSFIFPSLQHIISRWSPLFERATVANLVYGGSALGFSISMPLTGAICGSKMGWPVAFYGYGGVGLAWALLFAIVATDSPSTNKFISEEEIRYIKSGTSVTEDNIKKVPTPWKAALTSPPVWILWIYGCAQCYGNFTLLTEIPSYMSNMMNFDIKDNSQLSALPYLALFVTGLITSPISDRLAAKGVFSITTLRKIFNSLGAFIQGAALIYLAFVDSTQKNVATVLLVLTVGASGFIQSGYTLSLMDIAPNCAGPLFALVNGTNNVFSILGPLIVGLLGSDKKDPILWRKVFLITAGLFIGCGIVYDVFATSEVQPWNNRVQKQRKKNLNKNKNQTDVTVD